MQERIHRAHFACALFVAACALSPSVLAAPKDAAAKKLNDDAIMNDYLALNMGDAVTKLQEAIRICGADHCSPTVVARAHRDLGTIYVVGLQQSDEGRSEFVLALQADPTIRLDADLSTPAAEAVFKEALAQAGNASALDATSEPAVEETAAEPEEAEPAPVAVEYGALTHDPPTEQAVLTPVPVYVEVPVGVPVARVWVRYLPYGSSTWKSLELRKMRSGYGGTIPCLDVGSVTGDLAYYIEVVDEEDTVLATAGTKDAPHRVAIRTELLGELPHLPGRPPPAQCQDASDCPPEFPGCDGGTMEDDAEQEASGSAKLNWITLSGELDLLAMSGTDAACVTGDEAGYECFYGNGQQRIPGQDAPTAGTTFDEPGVNGDGQGVIDGGLTPATIRVMVGYDRVLWSNLTLGARVGFAFNGGPTGGEADASAFLPVHAEGSVGYYFGSDPFARTGFRPFARISGGLAQVDAKLTGRILDTRVDSSGRTDLAADASPVIEAWKKAGVGFAAFGLGTMYAIGVSHGPLLELKGMLLFPNSAFAAALQLGYGVGF